MARYISHQVMFDNKTCLYEANTSYENKMHNLRIRSYNWQMIDKETWKIGTDCDKMEKLIKYNMPVQYHKKCLLWEKKQKLSKVK